MQKILRRLFPATTLISCRQSVYLSFQRTSSGYTWFAKRRHTEPAPIPSSLSGHVPVSSSWLNFFNSHTHQDNPLDLLRRDGLRSFSSHFTRSVMSTNTRSSTDEPEVKRNKMSKKIGTHNGTFHCDEVMACFLIQLLPEYKDSTIVRTRDSSKLDECDIVVDVGGVYDEKKLKFDHHQRTFNESMNSLNPNFKWVTKLSSAGLIYYHYGRRIIEQILELNPKDPAIVDIIYDKIYENFVEEIDGIDNGINQTEEKPKYHISTHISKRVAHLNPRWNEDDFDEDELFRKAMKLVGDEFVDRILFYKKSWLPAREIVLKALEGREKVDESNEILHLTSGGCPWKDHLLLLEKEKEITPSIKYVLYTDLVGNWRIQCVPVHPEGFSNRLSLPEEWRGLRDEKLSEKSGIKDCIFVHATGFIGGNKTYDGALEMARMALKNKKED
ncbi:UPF0160 protein,UPF0160 protein MYG1, mitochondrial,UPF0160 protein C694.04c,UPF0160 protein C27H6.8,UPF0160 protein YER156C [Acanthosepion pharaonis]|uniref:UPF0160 protein,UPF0160 protein MYG1, mitochondrial,UPF0160 protein C694.04c,UPF0160 protein C27H6.8,UPF0160 protein YER156C n=1 Tax=Acanthosepion pharaonis TaxID=158019 RepID=A0A812DMH2_ACAPH|nr:UPF0160 protein,UPF0160 protein MYG1, mitochondrial,UPF0160 protein C694.04c,UPF0160 protein C27H6.8,UPF0160 protein YER156C [Sepia pharaonis]